MEGDVIGAEFLYQEHERKRILKMVEESEYAICPNCKKETLPRGWNISGLRDQDSNVRWCSHCLKGKARMFWLYTGRWYR